MSADIEEQYDKIYRYCYFKTQNAALAEDLTQECFLKYLSEYLCGTWKRTGISLYHSPKSLYGYFPPESLCPSG